MKELRVLFTCVGRRVELIEAFRDAAVRLDVRLRIYGTDIDATAPAMAYCDRGINVCGIFDGNYITELSEICKAEKIDVLIPTIDTDLPVLSAHVDEFADTTVMVSSSDVIAICRDKAMTSDFFRACGCLSPRTVDDLRDYDGSYPCIIKPKSGSGSVNTLKADSEYELKVYAEKIRDYVIQPFIKGTEYTVDIFCDLEGNPVYITPRVRLKVRSGEVLKTRISMDERIICECGKIVEKLKPVGPVTVQLIRQDGTGEDFFIEINPRFGGGCPLSMRAGADSAEYLLRTLLARPAESTPMIDDNAIFSRFDRSLRVSEGEVKGPVKGIIFDLDDTLYDEISYVRSGFRAVADYLGERDAEKSLLRYFESGVPPISAYLDEIGMKSREEECLLVYRGHSPDISLDDERRSLLFKLRKRGIKIGIITDGRPEGQRLKIEALGLDELADDIIITDELGGEQFRKPCDISFRIMQRRWRIPAACILYVGDNPDKDLQAPRQLGMQCLLYENKNGLYRGKSGRNMNSGVQRIEKLEEIISFT